MSTPPRSLGDVGAGSSAAGSADAVLPVAVPVASRSSVATDVDASVANPDGGGAAALPLLRDAASALVGALAGALDGALAGAAAYPGDVAAMVCAGSMLCIMGGDKGMV